MLIPLKKKKKFPRTYVHTTVLRNEEQSGEKKKRDQNVIKKKTVLKSQGQGNRILSQGR